MDQLLELALENYGLQIAMAGMAVDIGERIAYGQDVTQERTDFLDAVQLNRLFLYEYGQPVPDIRILQEANLAVASLTEIYQLHGTHIVDEAILNQLPARSITLTVAGDGSASSGDGQVNSPFANIKILPTDFDATWNYRSPWIKGATYTLDFRGGATLNPATDYTILPEGGFQLNNGITLDPADFIMLNVVSSFSTPQTT